MAKPSLYERLGGYDAISAVANDLLPRLQADPLLGRFWQNRGEDGIQREKQDHSGSPKRSEAAREVQVATALQRMKLGSVCDCVQEFDLNPRLAVAISTRHLFVHQFRDEQGRPELNPQSRVRDFEDPIAVEVSAITDVPAIDSYADRKADELLSVLDAIRTFREKLYETFEDEVVKLIAKRPHETRRRLQPFVDLWNFRHGRGPWAE
jgi:hypothetical protein